jgi:hypothetical protein
MARCVPVPELTAKLFPVWQLRAVPSPRVPLPAGGPDGRIITRENTMDPEQIGLVVGLVVAASLALQTALGPAMAGIVEAIKATGRTPEGYAGLVSLALGTGLGTAAGLLACAQSQQFTPLWIGVGAFAGLIGLGAGGVRSHLVAEGREVQAAQDKAGKAQKAAENAAGTDPAASRQGANLTLVETAEQEEAS